MAPLWIGFGLVGALVLAAIGMRTLWGAFRVRLGAESDAEIATPRRAFLTSLVATASNPLTIASWAAVFAAASVAGAATSASGTVALLAGVGLGSLTWVSGLAVAVSLARGRFGPRALRAVDVAAGSALVALGTVLGVKALGDGDPG